MRKKCYLEFRKIRQQKYITFFILQYILEFFFHKISLQQHFATKGYRSITPLMLKKHKKKTTICTLVHSVYLCKKHYEFINKKHS